MPRTEQTASAASDLLDAALSYAHRGWPVFPVRGKVPLTPHGVKDATTDPIAIREWWNKWPDANIGIATGLSSHLVVLDIDGVEGENSLKELEAQFGKVPATLEAQTGNSGRHLYFESRDERLVIRNSSSTLGRCLDVRGEGGYVVAPPSIHVTTRKCYQWINREPPLPVPAWIAAGKPSLKLAFDRPQPPARIREGSRNATLASLAGTMRRPGMTQDAIEAALLAENTSRCDPPLPETEVRLIARSISRYPSNEHQTPNDSNAKENRAAKQRETWPRSIGAAAYHGVFGDLVNAIAPNTEADPAALLIQALVMFGNVIGRTAHWRVEADSHYLNLNVVLVGATGKGRKGTASGHARRVFEQIDSEWIRSRVTSGLSSGEGLIWAVRDAIEKQESIKERGRVIDYQIVVDDPGIADKRLLVIESEFSSTLRVLGREGNILSALIRQAWDGQDLRALTKNTPAKATGAHISIVGQITRDELRRDLDDTETANGFGNRFLWVCVCRSKELPDGGGAVDLDPFIPRIKAAVEFARQVGEVRRDLDASALWHRVYGRLSAGRPGLLGAMTARAEAQVMRLSCLYALGDVSPVVKSAHLRAALEVWRYCFDSSAYIFGGRLGDPTADEILNALRGAPLGLTRSDLLHGVFGRNRPAAEISRALGILEQSHLARREEDRSGSGRPVERWFALTADDINDIDDITLAVSDAMSSKSSLS
jgi:hypothetical protein